nr:hypothetical protein [Tanacetum cinerariifolium]
DDVIRHLQAEKDILSLLTVGPTDSSFDTKALETENAQLKKSLTSFKRSKYIVPPRRVDWVPSTPLPKKKQVTPQEPQRTSPRFTQKPPNQHKKPTVPINSFSQSKPTTEARKPIPKRHSPNSNPFSSKSVQARRAAEYNRNLYVDISQFVDCSSKSVKTKPHQAKHVVNTSTNVWNATKNTVARIVPIWKPTEPIDEPVELTPSVSSNANLTIESSPNSLAVIQQLRFI